VLDGRSDLRLSLPDDAWVDVEAAVESVHSAEASVTQGDWQAAWLPAQVALHVASRPFLPTEDLPWIEERRRLLHQTRVRALECVAAATCGIGGSELAAAERCARTLTELEPYRESGYRLLMEALAARDNVAEALLVYDRLRVLLRDELGVAPGARIQELHKQLLAHRG
jgi:DNA-binding SARP family transcriptional activator